jgi:hypothetical protein
VKCGCVGVNLSEWECEGALATLGCVPSLLSAPLKQVGSSPFFGISSMPCHSS